MKEITTGLAKDLKLKLIEKTDNVLPSLLEKMVDDSNYLLFLNDIIKKIGVIEVTDSNIVILNPGDDSFDVEFETPEVGSNYMITAALYKNENLIKIIDNANITMNDEEGFTCQLDEPIPTDGNYFVMWSLYHTLFQRKRGPRTDISGMDIVLYDITDGSTIGNEGNLEVGKDYDYRLFVNYSNGERIDVTTSYDRIQIEHQKIYDGSELENVSKVGLFSNEPRKVKTYIGKIKAKYTDPTILQGTNQIEEEFIFHAFAGTGILHKTILTLKNNTFEKDTTQFDFFKECQPILEGIYRKPDNRVIFDNNNVVYRFYRENNEISSFDITKDLGVVTVQAYKQTNPDKYAEFNILVTENTTSIFEKVDLYYSSNNGTSLFKVNLDSQNRWYHKPFVLQNPYTVTFWLKLTYRDGTAPKWVAKKTHPDDFSTFYSTDPDWENQAQFNTSIEYKEKATTVKLNFEVVLTYQLVLERLELISNHQLLEFNLQKSCDPCDSGGCDKFIVPFNDTANKREIQIKAYFNNGFNKLYDLDDDSIIVKYGTLGDINRMSDLNLNTLPEHVTSVSCNIWVHDTSVVIANDWKDIYSMGTFNIIQKVPKMVITNYEPVSDDDYLTLQFNEHPILNKGIVVTIPMKTPYNASNCEKIIDSSSSLEEIKKVHFMWVNPLNGHWEDLYQYDEMKNKWFGRLEPGLTDAKYNDVKVTYEDSLNKDVIHNFINLKITDYGITNKIVSIDDLIYNSDDTIIDSTQSRNVTSYTDIKCKVTLDNGEEIYIKPDRVLPVSDTSDFVNQSGAYKLKSARVIIDFNKTVSNSDLEWPDLITITVLPAKPMTIYNMSFIDNAHPGAIKNDPIYVPYTFDIENKDAITFTVKYSDGIEKILNSNNLEDYQHVQFVPNAMPTIANNYEPQLIEYLEVEFSEIHQMSDSTTEVKRVMDDFDLWMSNIDIPNNIVIVPNKIFEDYPIVANEYMVDPNWDGQLKFAITNYNANFTYSLDWSRFTLKKVTETGLQTLDVHNYLDSSLSYEYNASGDRLFLNLFFDRSKFGDNESYQFEMLKNFVNAYFINTTSGHRHDITNINSYLIPKPAKFIPTVIQTARARIEYIAPTMFRFVPVEDLPTGYAYYTIEETDSGKLLTYRDLTVYSTNENTVGVSPTIHDILPTGNIFSSTSLMDKLDINGSYTIKFYDVSKNLVKSINNITWNNEFTFNII